MKKELLGALALGIGGSLSAQEAPQSPNLVLFIADDCSYYDLGCYGSVDSQTPRIDAFAKEGVQFTKGYQATPMSSPTRHNLFTGVWPIKSGAYPNHTSVYPDVETITDHLKPLGYKVALFGKLHIGPKENFDFDLYEPSVSKGGDLNWAEMDKFVAKCEAAGEPYCLLVATNQPHTPWTKGDTSKFNPDALTLPPMFVDIPETRTEFVKYLAEVNYMDGEFGQLLDMLDKHDAADDSVVVYLSEQGNSLPFAKWTCYDVGVHSAYIVRYGDKLKPRKSDAIVEYVDIVPTFVDFAGGTPSPKIDGESIKPILMGETKKGKKYTYSQQTTRGINGGSPYYGVRSVCDGRYRYIINLTPEAKFDCAFTSAPLYKSWLEEAKSDKFAKEVTTRYQHRPAVELYDVNKDIYCLNNLAGNKKYAKKIAELDKVLREWMFYCGDKGQETEMLAPTRMGKAAQAKIAEQESASKKGNKKMSKKDAAKAKRIAAKKAAAKKARAAAKKKAQ